MNVVMITGRLTKDVEVRYTQSQLAVANFTVACDKGKDKNGNDMGADFIPVTVYGKQAENCERYLAKGRQVAVEGRYTTGSYEKDGQKVYTTNVTANRVEFLGGKQETKQDNEVEIPTNFQEIDEDIPF